MFEAETQALLLVAVSLLSFTPCAGPPFWEPARMLAKREDDFLI